MSGYAIAKERTGSVNATPQEGRKSRHGALARNVPVVAEEMRTPRTTHQTISTKTSGPIFLSVNPTTIPAIGCITGDMNDVRFAGIGSRKDPSAGIANRKMKKSTQFTRKNTGNATSTESIARKAKQHIKKRNNGG